MEFLLENKSFATLVLIVALVIVIILYIAYTKVKTEQLELEKKITELTVPKEGEEATATPDEAKAVVSSFDMKASKTWLVITMVLASLLAGVSAYALAKS